ncbi:MAG TPA: helix-turn-helix domain-containing protein [Cyclobacteriaceae bacterium]|nr:helix-turn-helix domain-containing protein [Cyclobacteriaceae bacterium]
MFLGKNLRYLRKQQGLTQKDIADKLDIKRTMISAYEEGRSEPKLSSLNILAAIFQVSVDNLLNRDIEVQGKPPIQEPQLKILTVAVDKEDNENITMIGQKASAGYLNGFSDPEYFERLPQFHLPNLSKNATYRAFEIKGDSMLPLVEGTIIIGAFVENIRDIKNGKTYVLVTASEGVVYKRVFNYLEENGKLFLSSDNELYKPYEVLGSEILEVWEAKAFISTDFPHPKDKSAPLTLEDISQMILELKSEIRQIKL